MPIVRKVYIVLAALLLGTVVGLLIITIRYNQVFTTTTDWVHHTIVVLDADHQALSGLHEYEAGMSDARAL